MVENNTKMPVCLPGLNETLLAEVEERVSEFEREHEQDVIHGGPGYVDRIRSIDYIIVIAINAILGIYYFWAILS